MDEYLQSTEIIDHDSPAVQSLAKELAAGSLENRDVARRCFEWVRDEIKHSGDFKLNPTTCAVSEVLCHKTG